MPEGLAVYNDDNYLQIDSTYENLVLIGKHTAVTTSVGGMIGPSLDTHSRTDSLSLLGSTAPLIALRCASYASVRYLNLSTNSFDIIVNGPLNTSVTAYIFDRPTLATLSGQPQFQVFNPAGVLCFDSRLRYMRVVGHAVEVSEGPLVTNYPAGRTYASVVSNGGGSQTVATGAPPPNNFLSEIRKLGARWSGVQRTILMTQTDSFFGSYGGSIFPGSVLDIDVTNY